MLTVVLYKDLEYRQIANSNQLFHAGDHKAVPSGILVLWNSSSLLIQSFKKYILTWWFRNILFTYGRWLVFIFHRWMNILSSFMDIPSMDILLCVIRETGLSDRWRQSRERRIIILLKALSTSYLPLFCCSVSLPSLTSLNTTCSWLWLGEPGFVL